MPQRTKKEEPAKSGALGIKTTLWAAADKLRGHLDAADYKQVVPGRGQNKLRDSREGRGQ
ncbi:hypothetical protein JKG47_01980 [Acidithiobacillus sp. MC6.1]|nr:hypothetical protein [Acidithiobacillus sp. MC6.1]